MRSRRHSVIRTMWMCAIIITATATPVRARDWWIPYDPPCTERENEFAFAEKPTVKVVGKDRYEISFAVTANCDVTVGIFDEEGKVVRHLGAGVLGANAPEPFQKNTLSQKIEWNGKDDLDFYVKNPEKMKAKVMLGFKPVHHRNIGGTTPYDVPGRIQAIAADEDGVYVISKAHRSRATVRKFNHDMTYIASLIPPPANLPESKLQGMGYIEYEPGKKGIQAMHPNETMTGNAVWLPCRGGQADSCQPAISKGRLYYLNKASLIPSFMYYIRTDGSTDDKGCRDRPFLGSGIPGKRKATGERHDNPRLAASPDGKWIYMVDIGDKNFSHPVVWRASTDDASPAKAFIGTPKKPGADNASLNGPCGISVDTKGRIYVADRNNQRIQVFTPDGKHAGTLEVDTPEWVWVHQKTGELYVVHSTRVEGKGTTRLAKYSAFPAMKKLFHFDGLVLTAGALDSWSDPARIWVGGGVKAGPRRDARDLNDLRTVTVWEEQGKSFKKVFDFEEEAMKAAGANYMGRWRGTIRNKVVCDPSREQVYITFWHNASALRFDIESGRLIQYVRYYGDFDDIAFDKRGYQHAHFNPSFYQPGVGRFDPDQLLEEKRGPGHLKVKMVVFKEVPYDYGVIPKKTWKTQTHLSVPSLDETLKGVLDVKDQGGSKYFQDGFGVNMRGDVAEECNIYYVPKMDDVARDSFEGSSDLMASRVRQPGMARPTYQGFLKEIAELRKSGQDAYFIKRAPGIFVSPATVWVFDRTGELREECAVIAGNLINGVQIDEDYKLYFSVNRQRLHDGKVFLAGRMGNIGGGGGYDAFTGTYIKSRENKVRVLTARSPYAPVPLDKKPDRPVEVGGYYGAKRNDGKPGEHCWVEGAEWFYAGVSPLVTAQPCSCPTLRCGLDWYKRSIVIEQYRHSFGILDANGNLIMHMGQYGNRDSGDGAKSAIPVGGDNIVTSFTEYVSATDNFICFDDNGERLAAVRITYHAEEEAAIPPP